jgi:metacaspase-1
MANGRSIHIGLNSVDPDHYDGWSGNLVACEFDANDMEAIAEANAFETQKLLTSDAKAEAVIEAIAAAAGRLESGDILFVSYSGHGGQVPDANSDEPDRKDETWCLFDRELIDDELYSLWARFQPGVRILVLSDSCHSGSAARRVRETIGLEPIRAAVGTADTTEKPRFKVLPLDLAKSVYEKNKDVYDRIQAETTAHDQTEVPAHVLLISGCLDNQTSADGDRNGLFTQTLRKVWNDGAFQGDHRSLWKKIVEQMPPWQSPNYFWASESSMKFERQRPFSI